VAKEAGQTAATVVATNIEKMYSRMPAGSLGNAVWTINQEVWPQIFQLSHAVGVGGVPMFVPAGGLASAPAGTLLGRPIVPIEQAAALGTPGDIAFCDFKQYLAIRKGGTQTASSIHVRFLYDESVYRFVLRFNGAPIPNSPLTPYKGSATVSPFIVLAVRA
jgi:HK97 family phage major capsid protein